MEIGKGTGIGKALLISAVLLSSIIIESASQEVQDRDACDLACELLRNRIETAGLPPKLAVGDQVIFASEILPVFYERRAYRLAWSGSSGPLAQARELVGVIENADLEGLRPADYHLEKIRAIMLRLPVEIEAARPVVPHVLVDLDLLLTDAFLMYASHLLKGRVDPETIDPEWYIGRSDADLAEVLERALSSSHIVEALAGLCTREACAAGLRGALAHYRDIAASGGWSVIPGGSVLKKGDKGERVRLLRRRLVIPGYLVERWADNPEYFDGELEGAVRVFQGRHGLEVDGVVGSKTLAELNVTAEERVNQVMVNMERWRWLPKDLGERYILINIANFDLSVFEAGETVITMRVIVGKAYRRTPVFTDRMTYLVLNPYWNIPESIAIEDKIPLIRKDPEYLDQNKIKVLKGWGAETREIDPGTVDWSRVSEGNFRFRLRQDPGPMNALGRIKFMFPNKFNVYLHDTPSRDLFERNIRTFSSGCIRVEKPFDLAGYLLRADPTWTRPALLAAVEREEEQTVRLPEPITIHVIYSTAWIDDEGNVQFRQDIYERDRAVQEALRSPPPDTEI